jgi:hypothetical protein
MYNNAVPMTNGILMDAGSSLTYFIMSLITIIFLYANHEAVSYMVLDYWNLVTLLYGLIILGLGITCLVRDLTNIAEKSLTIWEGLSTFEKDFFSNSSMELKN